MAERSVISVHTKPETAARLARLAKATQRSKSFLANEAIEQFLAAEEAFIEGIEQGIEEVEAGHAFTTDELLERAKERILSKPETA